MLWMEKFSKKMALRGLRMGLCAISGLCRVTLNVPLSTVSTTAGLSCGKKRERERERVCEHLQCVCVHLQCVCVCERESVSVSVCVCVCVGGGVVGWGEY